MVPEAASKVALNDLFHFEFIRLRALASSLLSRLVTLIVAGFNIEVTYGCHVGSCPKERLKWQATKGKFYPIAAGN